MQSEHCVVPVLTRGPVILRMWYSSSLWAWGSMLRIHLQQKSLSLDPPMAAESDAVMQLSLCPVCTSLWCLPETSGVKYFHILKSYSLIPLEAGLTWSLSGSCRPSPPARLIGTWVWPLTVNSPLLPTLQHVPVDSCCTTSGEYAPPGHGQTLHPSPFTPLCFYQSACCSLTGS